MIIPEYIGAHENTSRSKIMPTFPRPSLHPDLLSKRDENMHTPLYTGQASSEALLSTAQAEIQINT
jgi:hypothetical protein